MPWAGCSSLGELYLNFQNTERENNDELHKHFPRRERSNCFRLSFTQESQTWLELYQGPFPTLHCRLFHQKSFLSPPLGSSPTTHCPPSILVGMTRITLVPLSLSGLYLMMLAQEEKTKKTPGSIKENKKFFCAFARVKGDAILTSAVPQPSST